MAIKTKTSALLLKVSRWHFFYALAIAVQIIIFDAWDLLAPTALLQRWVALGLFTAVVAGIWYAAHHKPSDSASRRLVGLLCLADVAIASFAVYNQRGMAARAVMLFAIPIAVAAILRTRTAIWGTAILCIIGYMLAAVAYFVHHFNEGYKVELYGETIFYCASFLLVAGILSTLLTKDA